MYLIGYMHLQDIAMEMDKATSKSNYATVIYTRVPDGSLPESWCLVAFSASEYEIIEPFLNQSETNRVVLQRRRKPVPAPTTSEPYLDDDGFVKGN